MNLSLDTGVVIEILDGASPIYRAAMEAAVEAGCSIRLSAIVLHELAHRALCSRRPEVEMRKLDTFVTGMDVDPWTAEDALVAARVSADFANTGAPIGMMETMIAGHALSHDLTLVTRKVGDFIRVPGLRVIDWNISDKPLDHAEALASLLRRAREEK